jgi:signal transduction histidine kinase
MAPDQIEAQKLELLGQMTAAILHDLNSPMTYINSNNRHLIKVVNKKLTDHSASSEILEILDENETGIKQIKSLLSHIKNFIKNDQQYKSCFLHEIIQDSKRITHPQTAEKVKVILKLSATNDTIEAIPSQITQVIINLIVNAIEAFPQASSKSEIVIETQSVDNSILITVSDNAGGIPEEQLHTIFDWYVTSKETGTGQGLAICKQIIEAHKGSINCTSQVNIGSRFSITLPELK